jgi:amino acid transporter
MQPVFADVPTSAGAVVPLRGIGRWGAVSANILNMIGIGPFITIPLALSAMGGPQAMLGWLVGAGICACDGLVWAELGSRLPRSGGPYHYLLEAFGPAGAGKLFGFIYLWLTLLIGPLSIASGAVGLSQYVSFLRPGLPGWSLAMLAAGVCLANTALLWRQVRAIGQISIAVTAVVVLATAWIIASGAWHFQARLAFDFPAHAFVVTPAFLSGLGAATLIAVYDYGGYNNVCMIGEEVRQPRRTIPFAVLVSLGLVAILYLGLNLSIIGTIPWRVAQHSTAIVADFMTHIYGPHLGALAAWLILIASWGSILAALLGYSRVPYAAAAAGQFFPVFARLHAKGHFPVWGLVYMGVASAAACMVNLADLIAILIVVQTLFQSVALCIAVIALRRQVKETSPDRFRMPLYPLPVATALVGWVCILATSKALHVVLALGMVALGTLVFLIGARRRSVWPFVPA